jgi:hypothetical protein
MSTESSMGTSIASIIQKVKDGVFMATHDKRFDHSLTITRLELTLIIAGTAKIEGEADTSKFPLIPVVKIGGGATGENAQTISLTLNHEEPKGFRAQGLYVPEQMIEQQLMDAILAIVEGVRHADEEPIQFALSEAVIDLEFIVTEQGGLKILFLGGEASHTDTHKLKLVMKRKAD